METFKEDGMKFNRKIIFKATLALILGSSLTIIIANYGVNKIAHERVFNEVLEVPNCKTALLLGTSKRLRDERINGYYKFRIDAAVALFRSHKIANFIISGDNGSKNYNEPEDMKNDLLSAGIPDSVIYLDYAGFRTFDSIIRAKEIFGQKRLVVVSQKFHNERAVTIGKLYGIEIYGFNAKDVHINRGIKTQIRELFARVKLFLDYIFNIEPRYLGDKVEIS